MDTKKTKNIKLKQKKIEKTKPSQIENRMKPKTNKTKTEKQKPINMIPNQNQKL